MSSPSNGLYARNTVLLLFIGDCCVDLMCTSMLCELLVDETDDDLVDIVIDLVGWKFALDCVRRCLTLAELVLEEV